MRRTGDTLLWVGLLVTVGALAIAAVRVTGQDDSSIMHLCLLIILIELILAEIFLIICTRSCDDADTYCRYHCYQVYFFLITIIVSLTVGICFLL
jgi:hypothetical protein